MQFTAYNEIILGKSGYLRLASKTARGKGTGVFPNSEGEGDRERGTAPGDMTKQLNPRRGFATQGKSGPGCQTRPNGIHSVKGVKLNLF